MPFYGYDPGSASSRPATYTPPYFGPSGSSTSTGSGPFRVDVSDPAVNLLSTAAQAPGYIYERPLALANVLTGHTQQGGQGILDQISHGIDSIPFVGDAVHGLTSGVGNVLGADSNMYPAVANASMAAALAQMQGLPDNAHVPANVQMYGADAGPFGHVVQAVGDFFNPPTVGDFRRQAAKRGFTPQDVTDINAGKKGYFDFPDRATGTNPLEDMVARVGFDPLNIALGAGGAATAAARAVVGLSGAGAAALAAIDAARPALSVSEGVAAIARGTLEGVTNASLGKFLMGVGSGSAQALRGYRNVALGVTAAQLAVQGLSNLVPAKAGVPGVLSSLYDLGNEVANDKPLSDSSLFTLWSATHFPLHNMVGAVVGKGKEAFYGSRFYTNDMQARMVDWYKPGPVSTAAERRAQTIADFGGEQSWTDLVGHIMGKVALRDLVPALLHRNVGTVPELLSLAHDIDAAVKARVADRMKTNPISGRDALQEWKDWTANARNVKEQTGGLTILATPEMARQAWTEWRPLAAHLSDVFNGAAPIVAGVNDGIRNSLGALPKEQLQVARGWFENISHGGKIDARAAEGVIMHFPALLKLDRTGLFARTLGRGAAPVELKAVLDLLTRFEKDAADNNIDMRHVMAPVSEWEAKAARAAELRSSINDPVTGNPDPARLQSKAEILAPTPFNTAARNVGFKPTTLDHVAEVRDPNSGDLGQALSDAAYPVDHSTDAVIVNKGSLAPAQKIGFDPRVDPEMMASAAAVGLERAGPGAMATILYRGEDTIAQHGLKPNGIEYRWDVGRDGVVGNDTAATLFQRTFGDLGLIDPATGVYRVLLRSDAIPADFARRMDNLTSGLATIFPDKSLGGHFEGESQPIWQQTIRKEGTRGPRGPLNADRSLADAQRAARSTVNYHYARSNLDAIAAERAARDVSGGTASPDSGPGVQGNGLPGEPPPAQGSGDVGINGEAQGVSGTITEAGSPGNATPLGPDASSPVTAISGVGPQEWEASLTPAERAAVNHYADAGYRYINPYLRGGQHVLRDGTPMVAGDVLAAETERAIPALDSAIAKGAVPEGGMTAWRGLVTSKQLPAKGLDALKPGDVIENAGYQSFSSDQSGAERAFVNTNGREYYIKAELPAGMNVGYLSPFDAAKGGAEGEILVGRGTAWVVKSVEHLGDAEDYQHVITVEPHIGGGLPVRGRTPSQWADQIEKGRVRIKDVEPLVRDLKAAGWDTENGLFGYMSNWIDSVKEFPEDAKMGKEGFVLALRELRPTEAAGAPLTPETGNAPPAGETGVSGHPSGLGGMKNVTPGGYTDTGEFPSIVIPDGALDHLTALTPEERAAQAQHFTESQQVSKENSGDRSNMAPPEPLTSAEMADFEGLMAMDEKGIVLSPDEQAQMLDYQYRAEATDRQATDMAAVLKQRDASPSLTDNIVHQADEARNPGQPDVVRYLIDRDAEVDAFHPSFDPEVSKNLQPDQLAKLGALQQEIRLYHPQYKLDALPQTAPDPYYVGKGSALVDLMKGQRMANDWFGSAVASKTADYLHTIFSPVSTARLSDEAKQEAYAEFLGKGASVGEVNGFFAALNAAANLNRLLGKVKIYRRGDMLPPSMIEAIARGEFKVSESLKGSNSHVEFEGFKPPVLEQVAKGDFAKMLDRSGSRFYRKLLENHRIEDGRGVLGETLDKAFGPITDFKAGRAGTALHYLSAYYHVFRFLIDPRWHLMNRFEADILGLQRYGFPATEMGGARELDRAGIPVNRDKMSIVMAGGKASDIHTTDAEKNLLADSLASGFLDNRSLEGNIAGAFKGQSVHSTEQAIREYLANDAIQQRLRQRFGGTVDEQVQGLHDMLYNYDTIGVEKTIDAEAAKALSVADQNIMAPLLQRITDLHRQSFKDITYTFHGNTNRSNLERSLNSYFLFWPISYQLKAASVLFKTLTEGALGRQTNLGGAWALNRLLDLHKQRLANDPAYVKMFSDHPELWRTAAMMLPITPFDLGVSLGKATDYEGTALGAYLGLWKPDSKKPELTQDPLGFAIKLMNIGPVYTSMLLQRARAEFMKKN